MADDAQASVDALLEALQPFLDAGQRSIDSMPGRHDGCVARGRFTLGAYKNLIRAARWLNLNDAKDGSLQRQLQEAQQAWHRVAELFQSGGMEDPAFLLGMVQAEHQARLAAEAQCATQQKELHNFHVLFSDYEEPCESYEHAFAIWQEMKRRESLLHTKCATQAAALTIVRAYVESHRSDIEHGINDFADLRPLLTP